MYKVYGGAYIKCAKFTMEHTLSVQSVPWSIHEVYKVYRGAYARCSKCRVEHILSVQSVFWSIH